METNKNIIILINKFYIMCKLLTGLHYDLIGFIFPFFNKTYSKIFLLYTQKIKHK